VYFVDLFFSIKFFGNKFFSLDLFISAFDGIGPVDEFINFFLLDGLACLSALFLYNYFVVS